MYRNKMQLFGYATTVKAVNDLVFLCLWMCLFFGGCFYNFCRFVCFGSCVFQCL